MAARINKVHFMFILLVLTSCQMIPKRDIDRRVEKQTGKQVDQIIDEKVAESLKTELPSAIEKGIGRFIVKHAGKVGTVIFALIAGKLGLQNIQIKRKNGNGVKKDSSYTRSTGP